MPLEIRPTTGEIIDHIYVSLFTFVRLRITPGNTDERRSFLTKQDNLKNMHQIY